MGPKLLCKGIVLLIDEHEKEKIKFDSKHRFYMVPKNLAKKYTQQSNVPVLLEHVERLPLGKVKKFYIDTVKIKNEIK